MAHGLLFAGHVPGLPGHHDPVEDQNGNTPGLRHPAPIVRLALCDLPALPVLLAPKEDHDLEQKKTTQWVVFP